MSRKYFLLAFLILPLFSIAQTPGCVDSSIFNKFYPSYFKTNYSVASDYTPQRDAADNIYLGGSTSFNSNLNYSAIIKFNQNNKLVWYKNYKYDIFSSALQFGNLVGIDEKADLLFFGGAGAFGGQRFPSINKIDSAGNYKWSKIIKRTDNPNLDTKILKPYTNNSNEIFCTSLFNDDISKIGVIALDGLGNIKWTKKYSHTTLPNFSFAGNILLVSQNNNVLVLCIQYYYNAGNPNDPATAMQGIQMIKISKADGSIIKQNAFSYFKNSFFNMPYQGALNKVNYNSANGKFLIDSYGELLGTFGLSHVYTLVDSDLNPLKTVWYKSLLPSTGAVGNGERSNIDEQNTITLGYTFTDQFFGPETFSYTAIDENLNLIAQKKINLTNLGFPNDGFVSDIAYKKNGVLNFQLVTTNDFGTNHIYLYDNSPYYNGTNQCNGIDTPIYVKAPMYFKPLTNVTIEEDGSVPVEAVSITIEPPIDLPLPKQEVCKEISICDTIKLIGTKYHCLSNPIDSFKIYRNPLCKRITNWQADTNYIKILSQNDSSLHVQYLQPYRGKIKVSFGGCSLADSIAIEVYNAQTGLNLGNDTMHCPGKTITLRAGKNFKTYLWQDGSSKDSLVAAQPGMYSVIATDSCGTVFKDTVAIKPMDVTLNLTYAQPLCYQDTASLSLPNALYNYIWQPATTAMLNGYNWRLFPPVTTTYRITGERYPGCLLSDTVLVRVKQCNTYLLFPNSFTPDDNGLNDLFKPAVKGLLQYYKLVIYNRYGQPVFTSTDAANGWNGSFKSSAKPQAGAYVWSCKYQFEGWPLQQEQGTFILIR